MRLRLASALLAGAALAALAPATAAASPPSSCAIAAAPVFAAFGDPALYFLVPGGDFEGRTSSWTLTGGARLAAGNESAKVGSGGSSSLSLPTRSSATSPRFCVDPHTPTMRLFLRNAGDPASKLGLEVVFTRQNGDEAALPVASFKTSSTAWELSPITYDLVNVLALLTGNGTADVSFRFRPLDANGAWSIDDVYVDPFKRCC